MNHLLKVAFIVAAGVGLGALPGKLTKPNSTKLREPFSPEKRGGAQSTLIEYHGGPLLLGAVPIYLIYYGSFPATTVPILNDFFSNIGGSPQYNVNTTYFDGAGNHITNGLSFSTAGGHIYFDSGSQGNTLGTGEIPKVIQHALLGGHLPTDSGGVYFLLTGPDIKVAGFCSSYCAYHTRSTSIIPGQDIKYAVVPEPGQKCAACDGNVAIFGQNMTPNGDLGADEMTDSIYHELSESVTDPDLNAWFTSSGAENADLCNFNYGATYTLKNGVVANAHLGKRDYLIQTIWENSGSGFCANTLP